MTPIGPIGVEFRGIGEPSFLRKGSGPCAPRRLGPAPDPAGR